MHANVCVTPVAGFAAATGLTLVLELFELLVLELLKPLEHLDLERVGAHLQRSKPHIDKGKRERERHLVRVRVRAG